MLYYICTKQVTAACFKIITVYGIHYILQVPTGQDQPGVVRREKPTVGAQYCPEDTPVFVKFVFV